MDFFTALIYGAIQGISEFLPVSSSGHLALLPYLMTIDDPGVVFDLCMHLGTTLAVMVYFRERIWLMVRGLVPALRNVRSSDPELVFLRHFILATGMSVVVILALRPFAEHARSPWLIAFNQAFFGSVLWLADVWQRRHDRKDLHFFQTPSHWKAVLFVGAAQALAIFPGVSRSGITLTAAYFLGVNRTQAGTFSFLLSLPIILAGVLVEVPHLAQAIGAGELDLGLLVVGMVTSFIVGYATIHYFMKLIAQVHLGWFTAYRFALAALLVFLLTR
jgi:undecaprenyl-diphosphatase